MHYAKYKQASLGNMLRHYERAKDENNEYIASKRHLRIDKNKTYLNYNLAEKREITQYMFLKNRLNEVYIHGRNGEKKNEIVKMCDWVITLPADVKKEDEKKFFQEIYNYFEIKYGRKNVISAYVHYDETTPHIHFCFIPVVPDKRRIEKLSAKECVKRDDLKKMHQDVEAYICKKMGYNVQMYEVLEQDDEKEKKNKSIADLKLETKKQEIIKQAKKEAEEIIKNVKLNDNIKRINLANARYDEFEEIKQEMLSKKGFFNNNYNIEGELLNKLFNLCNVVIADDDDIVKNKNEANYYKRKNEELEKEQKTKNEEIAKLQNKVKNAKDEISYFNENVNNELIEKIGISLNTIKSISPEKQKIIKEFVSKILNKKPTNPRFINQNKNKV